MTSTVPRYDSRRGVAGGQRKSVTTAVVVAAGRRVGALHWCKFGVLGGQVSKASDFKKRRPSMAPLQPGLVAPWLLLLVLRQQRSLETAANNDCTPQRNRRRSRREHPRRHSPRSHGKFQKAMRSLFVTRRRPFWIRSWAFRLNFRISCLVLYKMVV